MLCTGAHARTYDWDRAANVKDAAARLGAMHRKGGSVTVLKFLDACYRTHTIATEFTAGLEGCMAQDYMHSQILAMIYARVPDEQRKRIGAPSPQLIADSMAARFQATFAQYKFTAEEAGQLKTLVDDKGMPVFTKIIFPNAGKAPAGKPGSKAAE